MDLFFFKVSSLPHTPADPVAESTRMFVFSETNPGNSESTPDVSSNFEVPEPSRDSSSFAISRSFHEPGLLVER